MDMKNNKVTNNKVNFKENTKNYQNQVISKLMSFKERLNLTNEMLD